MTTKAIAVAAVVAAAFGTTATAAKAPGLPSNSVGTAQVRDGSLLAADFKAGQIRVTSGAQGPTGEKGEEGDRGPTGPRGFTGAQGDKGDKGDTGDTGPAAVDGITGYLITSRGEYVNAPGDLQLIGHCPAGTVALGGGISAGPDNDGLGRITTQTSYPSSSRTWAVLFSVVKPPVTVIVYAICATGGA